MNSKESPTLLLVDGHNLLWSATFGFPTEIKSQDKKRDLTGTFAFFAMLRTAIRNNLPDEEVEVFVVFDGEHGSSKRKELDPDYKANRSEDTDALRPLLFLPDIKRGLDILNICWIELDEEEADDVIATITEKNSKDRNILIYSQDKDFYQLVNEKVSILNTRMKSSERIISSELIIKRHGVSPSQWTSFRALTGDHADNIPGVKGVGSKTASKLLQDNYTLEDLFASNRISSGRLFKVREEADQIKKWERLIALNRDLDISVNLKNKKSTCIPVPAEILQELNLW